MSSLGERDKILLVFSRIPVGQRTILKVSSMTGIKLIDTIMYKNKLRPISFLNYPDNLAFMCKKRVIFQYIEDINLLDEYKGYLKKLYKYFQYLKKIEKDGEDIINTVPDKEIVDWLTNCTQNVYTNAELPLRYLDKSQFKQYLNSFEIEFKNYKYILISKKISMKNYLANIIDDLGTEGRKMFVTNLGKNAYCKVFMEILPKRGLPYHAFRNDKGGYDYYFPQQLQKFAINSLTINMLASENSDLDNLVKACKNQGIQTYSDYLYHPSKYYTALLNCKNNIPFLLLGPTGCGKSFFVVQILKDLGIKKYADLNCAVLSGGLFASKLFGYKKGAFTGADKDFDGFLKMHQNGVIFLDEIGELSINDQAKLLKYLDSSKFYPEGSTTEETSKALLIFASNRNLKEMMQKGEFREDLYYRITQVQIELPAFDISSYQDKEKIISVIVEEVNHKLETEARKIKYRYSRKTLTQNAINYICFSHNWPGNIRELLNTLTQAFIINNNIQISDLAISKQISHSNLKKPLNPFKCQYSDLKGYKLVDLVRRFQIDIVKAAVDNNKTKLLAARELGITEPTLYKYLKRGKTE